MTGSYAPFRFGVPERGKTTVCEHCGVSPANGYSLKQSGECDRIRYKRDEKKEAA